MNNIVKGIFSCLDVPPNYQNQLSKCCIASCWENFNLRMVLKGFIFIFSIVEKVGCFKDNANDRTFPTMLKDLRGRIDWHHPEKIVQQCAVLTKENYNEVRWSKLPGSESLVTNN